MRYVVDSLELSQEFKRWGQNTREYSFSYVCKNCGSELRWEYPFPYTIDRLSQWEYDRAKKELEAYREDHHRAPHIYTDLQQHEKRFARLSERWERERRMYQIKNNAHARYKAAHENTLCPICGAQLIREKGYYMPDVWTDEALGDNWYKADSVSWGFCDSNEKFAFMAKARNAIEQENIRSAANKYSESCNLYVTSKVSSRSADILQNCESLKNYILNLIHLENNIFSLKQNLAGLYYRRLVNDRLVVFSTHSPAYEAKKELDVLRTAYQEALNAVDEAKSAPLPVISVEYPSKPSTPVYATPGFFNKKKVQAENEMLRQKYEAALDEYRKEVQNCDNKKNRLTVEAQSEHDAAVKNAQDNAEIAKHELELAEIDTNNRINTANTYPVPAMAIKSILDREIEETEELLKKTFAVRNELYAHDIIFGKYRDAIALSSFYEYLMSGRCTTLTGADGAYNIYENEVRMNHVISQLDTVISSLEEIKQNQYMMYQEMRSINASLQSLNSSMDKALTSIQGIEANTTSMNGYMEHISQNSDVIAHNTSVTAYYSKVNAELTNALGYMVAFK